MSIPKPTKEHRKPLAAPFGAGTRLRYLGTDRKIGIYGDPRYLRAGDLVVVDHATEGRRGGMWPNPLDDGYGPAWVEDDTRDGVSVIEFEPAPGDYGHLVDGKRIVAISECDRTLWEVVP
jgi:hypothetical protein